MKMDSVVEVKLEDLHKEVVTSPEWADVPIYFVGDVGGTFARLGFARHIAATNHLHIKFVRFHMRKKDINELKDFFSLILDQVLGGGASSGSSSQKGNEAVEVASSSVAKVDAVSVAVDRAAQLGAHPFIARITYGAITVPGPVSQMRRGGPFNNLKGIADLEEYPTFLFPPGRSCIMNDLVGGAYGLVTVSEEGVLTECCKLMWEGTLWRQVMGPKVAAGSVLGRGVTLVLAQGSGLGAALIDYDANREQYRVTPLELGSLTVPDGIQSADYLNGLASYLNIEPAMADVGEAAKNASGGAKQAAAAAGSGAIGGRLSNLRWEHLVSATALEYNYFRIVKSRNKTYEKKKIRVSPLSVTGIVEHATRGDQDALDAVLTMYECFMKVCAESCMVLQPITCALLGTNIVHNQFLFERGSAGERRSEVLSRLQNVLLHHPMQQRGKFIGRPTFIRQSHAINLNIIGCYGVAKYNRDITGDVIKKEKVPQKHSTRFLSKM